MKYIIRIRRVVIMKIKSRTIFHSFFIVFVLDTSFLYKPKFKILTKLRYQNVVNWDDFGPKRLLCPTIAILIKYTQTYESTSALRLLALRGWRTLCVRRRLPSVAWGHIG